MSSIRGKEKRASRVPDGEGGKTMATRVNGTGTWIYERTIEEGASLMCS
jgi:hypothetical protein